MVQTFIRKDELIRSFGLSILSGLYPVVVDGVFTSLSDTPTGYYFEMTGDVVAVSDTGTLTATLLKSVLSRFE